MDPNYSSVNKKYLWGGLAIILGMFFWVWLNSPMIVSVTGTGEVSAPAESATLSFTLSSNDQNPQSAINSVTGKADAVRTFLLTKGISESDIAQSQVTAVPANLVNTSSNGFQATINMAAKTTHVSGVSELVSELYANGVIVVSQPVLSVGNQDELEAQALNLAMKDAKAQAGKLALRNWKFIRKIVAVSQTTSGSTSTATTKADAATSNTSIEAAQNGVFKIVKTAAVTYKLW